MFGDKIEDYEILEHLGKGGFAHVYRARCRQSGLFVAIKMIDKALMASAGMIGRVRQEVTIHSRLKHPAILELFTFFEDARFVYLVLELAHNGELAKHFKLGTRGLSEKAAADIFKQVLSGVLYLHTHNIIHRDLSLNNLLLTKDLNVKIADFGLATQLNGPDEKHVTMCGTPNYISPEVASRELHGLPADVWGLGCMLYTLLVGRPPFHTQHVRTTLDKVIKADYQIPSELSHSAQDLLQKLLCKDPMKRINLKGIMEHPFLNNCVLKQDMSRDSGFLTTLHSTQHSSKLKTDDKTSSGYNGFQQEINTGAYSRNSGQLGSFNVFQGILDNNSYSAQGSGINYPISSAKALTENKENIMRLPIPATFSTPHAAGTSLCESLKKTNINLHKAESKNLDYMENKENLPKAANVMTNTIGVPPLCAERLPSIAHRTRNAILKIEPTGVVVEFIKRRGRDREERVVEVCKISKDGMRIVIYAADSKSDQKDHEPTPDEVFSYHNLPQKHWKKYLYASRFVDLVKAKTPRITLYSPLAKCQLMENGTDIDMFFYTGEKVTFTASDGLKVIDKNLKTHLNPSVADEVQNLTDHFEECSNRIKKIQAALSCIADECFPLIIGKRPLQQLQKNNVVSSPYSDNVNYHTPLLNIGSFRTAASTQAPSDYNM